MGVLPVLLFSFAVVSGLFTVSAWLACLCARFFLAGRVLFGWTCVVIASFVVVVLVLLASWLSALSALSVVVGLCGERQVWGAESFGSVRQLSLV